MDKLNAANLHVAIISPEDVTIDTCLDAPIGVLATENTVTADGIIVKKNIIKYSAPSETLKAYKVSDFSMENLLACGAAANLTSLQYTDDDVDAFCNNLDDYTDNL